MQKAVVKEYTTYQIKQLGDIISPETTLNKGTKYLTYLNWWVSVGTAIGLYRDGDFIPNDTDIDVGVRAQKGIKPILIPGMTLIRETWVGDRIMQSAFIDSNECIFDIFYYYDDIYTGHLVTISENGVIVKPNMPTRIVETKYGKLPFLYPVEEYLFDRYGNGWKKPSNEKGRYADEKLCDIIYSCL